MAAAERRAVSGRPAALATGVLLAVLVGHAIAAFLLRDSYNFLDEAGYLENARLFEAAKTPEANIIKLPNISASRVMCGVNPDPITYVEILSTMPAALGSLLVNSIDRSTMVKRSWASASFPNRRLGIQFFMVPVRLAPSR